MPRNEVIMIVRRRYCFLLTRRRSLQQATTHAMAAFSITVFLLPPQYFLTVIGGIIYHAWLISGAAYTAGNVRISRSFLGGQHDDCFCLPRDAAAMCAKREHC